MADRSSIEWCTTTWNPTTGCDRVSPGCDNCYAAPAAARLKAMGIAKYQRDGDPATSGPGFGLSVHPATLDAPTRWRKPRLVFVDSMSDLFHPDVPDSFIADVFEVMAATPRHIYQVLTKRAQRLAALTEALPWPPNVWMGVSVETQPYAFRVEYLRRVPAAVRFVSAEPLLGPLSLNLDDVGWLIAGGESGPGARPVSEEWLLTLRDDCGAAAVPFFFKQWGGRHPKSGGRTLDGHTHDAYPAAASAAATLPSRLG